MDYFYENLEGWFSFEKFYKEVELFEGMKIVEIGCWKGKSSSCMAVKIANSGFKISFDCVDTWKGSREHGEQDESLYQSFIENMKPVEGLYNAKRMTSLEAAQTYEDGSLDLIWIDASHEYEDVKDDIQAWLPKLKKGGIIGGDDYHPAWSGVIQAVDELMPNSIHNEGPYWYQRIDS